MNKNIDKLNNIYIKNVTCSVIVEDVLKKLEEYVQLKDDPKINSKIICDLLIDNNTTTLGFNVCDCSHSFSVKDVVFAIDIESLPEDAEIITREEFQFFDKDNDFKELIKIERMSDYKDIHSKKAAINSFLKRKLSKENRDFAQIIKNLVKVNLQISSYNDFCSDLIRTNRYSIKCREILLHINGEENYGSIEIERAKDLYEEMQLHLHLDSATLYNNAITYESYGIFADIEPNTNKYVTNTHEFSILVEKTIDKSRTINYAFEVSFDGNFAWAPNDIEIQRFISFEEFKITLDRQIYNLKENADIIFGNLYKILLLLQADMIACAQLKD